MTTPHEKLTEAIQDYVREVYVGSENHVVNHWVLGVASIDLHTADTKDHVALEGQGPRYAVLGLAHNLVTEYEGWGDDE